MTTELQRRLDECRIDQSTFLDLANLRLTKLPEELAEFNWLRTLFIGDNKITDLSPLAELINLTALYCYNNQITDLSPLAELTNLTKLYCYSNQIVDFSPLVGLTKLDIFN